MAGGREYSAHQRKIIDRYYEHRDTIAMTSLSELVSELYLAETDKKKEALWKKAEAALAKLKASPAQVRTVLESRDPAKLAQLVGDLQTGG
jgi:hypothetical protein